MANSHPGSYCGQDAYSDMLITEERNELLHGKRTVTPKSVGDSGSVELYARPASIDNRGGW